MPLRVKAPTSPVLHVWRAPVWQRVLFPAVGSAALLSGVWPYAGEPYGPLWLNVLVGLGMVTYALRPKLTLHIDALHVRGFVCSRVIPVGEISAVEGGYGGLVVRWGDGRMTEATAVGEETNLPRLPGSDGRRHNMRSLILATRDAHLQRQRPTPLSDPDAKDGWPRDRDR